MNTRDNICDDYTLNSLCASRGKCRSGLFLYQTIKMDRIDNIWTNLHTCYWDVEFLHVSWLNTLKHTVFYFYFVRKNSNFSLHISTTEISKKCFDELLTWQYRSFRYYNKNCVLNKCFLPHIRINSTTVHIINRTSIEASGTYCI